MTICLRNSGAIINKPRQSGFSTAVSAKVAVNSAIRGMKELVISNNEDNAIHVMQYADDFMAVLKDAVQDFPKTKVSNMTQKLFANGGEIRCFPANKATIRGYPGDEVMLDEFAHFTGESMLDEKIMRAIEPSLAHTGGTLWVLSTPFGMVNLYAKMWHDEAIPPEDKLKVHYSQCPDLVKNIVREEVTPGVYYYRIGRSPKRYSQDDFDQEFCNVFLPGIGAAFSHDDLWAMLDESVETWT